MNNNSFEQFKRTIENIKETEVPDIEICEKINMVEDFILGNLDKKSRTEFIKHISSCDICREATAVLHSTDAISELVNSKESKFEIIKNELSKIKENLTISINNFFENFTPVTAGAFRSTTEKELQFSQIFCNEEISIYFCPENHEKGKIKVVLKSESLIELFDEKDNILKSVEDELELLCNVKKGIYKIIINSEFEVTININ